jgi:4-diphosphocytidyl-2C-methyl-D-erythritol kinase
MTRLQRKAPLATHAAKAINEAVGHLAGFEDLIKLLKALGADVQLAQESLAMLIQDHGEAAHRFERYRYAVLKTLEGAGIVSAESDIAYYEGEYDRKQKEKEGDPCPSV